jgi:hypothetical protein
LDIATHRVESSNLMEGPEGIQSSTVIDSHQDREFLKAKVDEEDGEYPASGGAEEKHFL